MSLPQNWEPPTGDPVGAPPGWYPRPGVHPHAEAPRSRWSTGLILVAIFAIGLWIGAFAPFVAHARPNDFGFAGVRGATAASLGWATQARLAWIGQFGVVAVSLLGVWKRRQAMTVLVLGLALLVIFVAAHDLHGLSVPVNENNDQATLGSLGPAFYLWSASLLITALAPAVTRSASSRNKP